jgi:predicted amidophosphoribosyltransferase
METMIELSLCSYCQKKWTSNSEGVCQECGPLFKKDIILAEMASSLVALEEMIEANPLCLEDRQLVVEELCSGYIKLLSNTKKGKTQ